MSKEKADRIAEEHVMIRERLSEMERTSSLELVHEQLSILIPVLKEHFAAEEELAQEEQSDPSTNVAGLIKVLGEHDQIMAQAQALRAACEQGGDAAQTLQRAKELVAFMRSHEERETEALMDAIWTDLGTS